MEGQIECCDTCTYWGVEEEGVCYLSGKKTKKDGWCGEWDG